MQAQHYQTAVLAASQSKHHSYRSTQVRHRHALHCNTWCGTPLTRLQWRRLWHTSHRHSYNARFQAKHRTPACTTQHTVTARHAASSTQMQAAVATTGQRLMLASLSRQAALPVATRGTRRSPWSC